jgi:hypothetical protein
MMPIRTLLLCAVVAPPALGAFAARIGPGLVVALVYAVAAAVRAARHDQTGEPPARSAIRSISGPPSALRPWWRWSCFFGHWTADRFGNAGASMALIGFTGLYDVDAALIAAANLLSFRARLRALGLLFARRSWPTISSSWCWCFWFAGVRRGAVASGAAGSGFGADRGGDAASGVTGAAIVRRRMLAGTFWRRAFAPIAGR